MPAFKPGGHEQGLRRTIVVALEPKQREKVEAEVAARKASFAWTPEERSISAVVRDALDAFFEEE